MLYEIILFAIAIILHEFGHWLGFSIFNIKTKIYFKDGCIFVDGKRKETIWQSWVITSMGIFAGLFVMLFTSIDFLFVYLIACFLDFAKLYQLYDLVKSNKMITKSSKLSDIKVKYKGRTVY